MPKSLETWFLSRNQMEPKVEVVSRNSHEFQWPDGKSVNVPVTIVQVMQARMTEAVERDIMTDPRTGLRINTDPWPMWW